MDDAELARACDTLADYVRSRRGRGADGELIRAAQDLILPIKEFIARSPEERGSYLDEFCTEMTAHIGELEARLPQTSEIEE